MSLVPVDLDNPANLNHRWASLGALYAAQGYDDTYGRGRIRHCHDGGGNWARMALLPGGRALLFGRDHEYSETYWEGAAEYFEEPETDLLAGAPQWWGEALAEHREGGEQDWIGFVYGWENGQWLRAPYDVDDGFDSVLPARDHDSTVEHITEWLAELAEPPAVADRGAIEKLVQAGPEVTVEQLAAAFPSHWDLDAGVAAARAFRLPN